jgi:quercetin dioxygenase-like cupin family protein
MALPQAEIRIAAALRGALRFALASMRSPASDNRPPKHQLWAIHVMKDDPSRLCRLRSGGCDSRTQWERKMAIHHASPGEVVDLRPLGEALSRARTTAIVKSEAFEAVRLIVHAGTEIDAHQVPGPIMLHCLEGRVILGLDATSLELSAGQWIYLDGGAKHSVRGIENSSLLLTILFGK